MELRFLGTGAAEGIPAIFCNCNLCKTAKNSGGNDIRSRFQIMINDDVLIDYPPDSYFHMLNSKLDFSKIKNIIFTHSHSDHFYPEDLFMRDLYSSYNAVTPLVKLHGSSVVIDRLIKEKVAVEKANLSKIDTFNGYDVYSQRVEYEVFKPYGIYQFDDYKVIALPSNHINYEPSLVYYIEQKGKKVLILSDTAILSDDCKVFIKNNIKNVDMVVYDCTYGLGQNAEGHMNFNDNKCLRDYFLCNNIINDKTQNILSHISHNVALTHNEFSKIAQEDNFIVAYDKMTINI